MIFRLRNQVVAIAILSMVLVGVIGSRSTGDDDACGECSVGCDTTGHGTREDDCGVASEQVEENDGDEGGSRDLHAIAADAGGSDFDHAIRRLKRLAGFCAVDLLCRGTLVRGPPARG